MNSEKTLKSYLMERAETFLRDKGHGATTLNENFNFIESGVLDSMGFVSFLEDIEREFKIEINFYDIDPTQFTSIAGILRHISVGDRA
jgi:acyl carrier protein